MSTIRWVAVGEAQLRKVDRDKKQKKFYLGQWHINKVVGGDESTT